MRCMKESRVKADNMHYGQAMSNFTSNFCFAWSHGCRVLPFFSTCMKWLWHVCGRWEPQDFYAKSVRPLKVLLTQSNSMDLVLCRCWRLAPRWATVKINPSTQNRWSARCVVNASLSILRIGRIWLQRWGSLATSRFVRLAAFLPACQKGRHFQAPLEREREGAEKYPTCKLEHGYDARKMDVNSVYKVYTWGHISQAPQECQAKRVQGAPPPPVVVWVPPPWQPFVECCLVPFRATEMHFWR